MLEYVKTVGSLFVIGLLIVGIVGYGLNFYKLTQCDFQAPYKAEIIRGIGIVPVVGAFTGYMDLGE